MSLNVLRFRDGNRVAWAVVKSGRIDPIPGDYATTGDFLKFGQTAARETARGAAQDSLREADVEVLSPVTRNQQFVCQAVNYRSHLVESRMDPEGLGANILFRKASSCIVGASSDIVRPARVRLLDYEVELGLVIGAQLTEAITVSKDTLHRFVAGIVIANDISARDIQLPEGQFYKGKSFRTFGPVGPYLCLLEPEEFCRLPELRLTLSVNGTARQNARVEDMVYRPAETLTELSEVMDLEPGDLIATGTPGGVALQAPPAPIVALGRIVPDKLKWRLFIRGQTRNPRYLKPGDLIESRIRTDDGAIDLGVQRNLVKQGA
jgi:2,4-diketo-3-deoxy-L-fuconate hydrolase